MLETIEVVLRALWLVGRVTAYSMGGLIHIPLLFAVVVILIRVIQDRRLERPWNSSPPPPARTPANTCHEIARLCVLSISNLKSQDLMNSWGGPAFGTDWPR
jgi:hypothetical protein